mmetsp:Transcript_11227/g.22086  ORF Transcript_11227/g.22086 Transcript_11227/m.22086 type:complete len:116 (-) Transcript_11227:37-384(-)
MSQAEAETNFDILARNMQLQSAALAEEGRLESAISNVGAWQDILSRNAKDEQAQAQYGAMMADMMDFNQELAVQIRTEQVAGLQLDEEQDLRQQRAAYYGDSTMAKISKMKRKKP